MPCFRTLLLFSLLPSATPSSVHRRLDRDRHTNDSFDEYDSLNPIDTNIFDPIVCSSNADGSFGETVGDLEEIIVSYRYNMDVGVNISSSDVLEDLEAQITNVLIRSANPDCPGPTTENSNALNQTGIVISGISTAPDDNHTITACLLQSGEDDTCYDVAGQLSLYVGRTRRFLLDGQNTDRAAELSIKDAMNSGELTAKVNGITRLEWVEDEQVTPPDESIETPESPSDESISVRINEELDNVGYTLLISSGVLLLGGYGIHRFQKRRKRNLSAQQSAESDDGFDQIA